MSSLHACRATASRRSAPQVATTGRDAQNVIPRMVSAAAPAIYPPRYHCVWRLIGERAVPSASQVVEQVFRAESGRILAGLIGALRDFSIAEDALQDAVVAALQQWPGEGVPRNPAAWLTTILDNGS